MRTSFFVGIFTLTVAIAGSLEWAGRNEAASDALSQATPSQTAKKPDAGLTNPPDVTADDSAAGLDTPQPVGTEIPSAPDAPMLVLAEGQGGFRLNAVTLSDEAIASIDKFVAGLDPEAAGVHFVIEGHTDSLGSEDVNQRIGLARALAVRQYLVNQCEMPRELMRVVSYGSSRPMADNATQEGRMQNRRVVIRVLQ